LHCWVNDLEHQLRVHTEDHNGQQERGPGNPFTDSDVLDVTAVIVMTVIIVTVSSMAMIIM
jgi:hypothetical protein